MQRVQCAFCGAPSVLGASRCPRCLAPFGAESPTSGVVLPSTPVRTAGRRGRWLIAGAALAVAAVATALMQRGTSAGTSAGNDAVDAAGGLPAPDPAVLARLDSGAVTVAETTVVPGAAAASPAAPVASPAPSGAAPSVPVPSVPTPSIATRPSGAVSAEPAGFAYEATTWVRVRVQPDNGAQVLAVLAPGTRVEVVEIGRGWLRVRVPEGEGWAGARLLTRIR